MPRHYNIPLPVAPFLIAPVARENKEAALVIGPPDLALANTEIIDLLHGPVARLQVQSPILAQVQSFRGKILSSVTIRTTVPDAASSRLGLKLTVGVVIDKRVSLYHVCVMAKSFALIDRFFGYHGYQGLSLESAGQLVANLQREGLNLDQHFHGTEYLIQWFESIFCIWPFGSPEFSARLQIMYRLYRVLRTPRRQPSVTMTSTLGFWNHIDTQLQPKLGKHNNHQQSLFHKQHASATENLDWETLIDKEILP